MIVSKKALLILIVVLMCSVLMAKLLQFISVTVDYTGSDITDSDRFAYVNDKYNSQSAKTKEHYNTRDLRITDTPSHLMWFLQISDLHISIFHDPLRVSNLKEFCDITVGIIKPTVVLASGDLTDAKTADNMGSSQYLGEWTLYKSVLDECHVMEKTTWLDVRGNHDNFNIINRDSSQNYFRNYSMQGANHPRSYLYQTEQGDEMYSFIAVDACLDPGPRRPFNFIGMLSLTEANYITKLAEASHRSGANHTIWFGHYPTSAILAPGSGGLRSIISKHARSMAYLCGHFHTLGGAVPNMYTLHHEGFLELELGDWKDNRLFRLMAVDHGLMSFVDVKLSSWPLILVTNPKNAHFLMPTNEPLKRIQDSSHIRILTFSNAHIVSVKVRMDDGPWEECTHVKGPLYVAPWIPLEYSKGVHEIHVFVKDSYSQEKIITQPFSVDGTRLDFPVLARIILMSNISLLFQVLFGIMTSLCVIPLCILRYCHYLVKVGRLQKPRCSIKCLRKWLRKLWVLSTIDRMFYPLVIYALYLTVGPWAVGEVIEDYTGVIFAWGTIVNGQYLPGSFTYAYGFMQMCCFQVPLTLILADTVDLRLYEQIHKIHFGRAVRWRRDLLFLLVIVAQLTCAYFFWLAYGIMAFLLGPLRTWSAILAGILWYHSAYLPIKCLKSASGVWFPNLEPQVFEEPKYETGSL